MGKLLNQLEKQLKSEYTQEAEECLKIYNKLIEIEGSVWSSEWQTLVKTSFKGFPNGERICKPTKIGYIFLKGIG